MAQPADDPVTDAGPVTGGDSAPGDADPGLLYLRAAQEIRRRIREGVYPPTSRLPTQVEFARDLKVSQMTVRRAMAELVEQGLLHARPGSGTYVAADAPAQPAQATRDIACIFEDVADGYPLVKPVVRAITDACHAMDYGLRLIEIPGMLATWEDLASRLPRPIVGALVFSPIQVHLLSLLQRRGVPYVLVQNDFADGVSHSVTTNYAAATVLAGRRLLERGCRRLCIVTAGALRYSAGQMRIGADILRQLHAGTLDAPLSIDIVHGDYTGRGLCDLMEPWRDPQRRPDGLFLIGDAMVEIALFGLRQLKLRVPQDVALVQFGNTPDAQQRDITCIERHNDRIGDSAVRVLDQLIARQSPPMRTVIQPELVVRGSA
jgi:DNA-binding LacI/PurR family transcriptional regulator